MAPRNRVPARSQAGIPVGYQGNYHRNDRGTRDGNSRRASFLWHPTGFHGIPRAPAGVRLDTVGTGGIPRFRFAGNPRGCQSNDVVDRGGALLYEALACSDGELNLSPET